MTATRFGSVAGFALAVFTFTAMAQQPPPPGWANVLDSNKGLTRRAFWVAAATVLSSACLAATVEDRFLTPLFFYLEPETIPGIRWTVVGAQLVVLTAMLMRPIRGWGLSLASAFAVFNLMVLSLNGLSALMFFNYGSRTDWQGFRLLLFLAAQAIALLGSAICTLAEIGDRKASLMGVVLRAGVAVGIAIAWGTVQWRMAGQ